MIEPTLTKMVLQNNLIFAKMLQNEGLCAESPLFLFMSILCNFQNANMAGLPQFE